MADQYDQTTDEQAVEPVRDERRRSLWGALGVVCTVIILLLLLLLIPRCGSEQPGVKDQSDKTIESVAGLEPEGGVISVWIKPGEELDPVLKKAGIPDVSFTNVGEDKYVVVVREGTEAEAIDKLQALAEVYDAGLVYKQKDEGK